MAYDPEKITFFAQTDARGQRTRFGIKAEDRARHVYAIGKTGMGKSTMLENMAIQDIQNGHGLAFIDPHGSSAEKLLEYIPEERVNDVIYFAPFDMEYPVAFNIMEDVGPDKRHLVVSGLMSVFEKLWVDQWSARMSYILQNALMALLEYPDSTLLGVNKMLSDKKYREKVVANVTDPAVRSFWVDEFAKYTDRFAAEATPAIQNKIGQFTSNPLIRNVIGQPKSSFDIRTIMDEQKILIMNLSKGLVGESNANLLGSMLTTRIYLAAMSRADLNAREMEAVPNFYFYVDEFQSFANATFANILSESRKYKLNLTIAHQYIEQMEEEVKNAVFGNVGTIITFRVGPFDAEVLETIFAPQFMATDIVNLSARQIYLTLMIDGVGSPPFSATTLPPIEPPSVTYKNVVIAASREKFARKRTEVEAVVERFHGPDPAEEQKPQQNNRGSQGNNNQGRNGDRRENEQRNNGNQERRQNDRRGQDRKKPNHRPEPPKAESHRPQQKKQKEQNLDELRSVLKNLSRDEGDVKTKDAGGKTPRPQRSGKPGKSNTPDTKSALKDVLKNVVSENKSNQQSAPSEQQHAPSDTQNRAKDETKAAPPAQAVPAQKEKQQTQKSSDEAVQRDTAPTPAPRAAGSQMNGAQPASKDTEAPQEISPKELERMMRIKTSDRTPFR